MGKYLSVRVLYAILALIVLASLTFFMMQAMPGDPFLRAKKLPPAVEQNLKVKFGLDKPLVEQFFVYMGNVATGEMGYSFESKRPAVEVLLKGVPYSFELGIWSILLALGGGLYLGITAALHAGRTKDAVAMFVAIIGVSVPSFVIGYILQYYIAFQLSAVVKDTFHISSFIPVTGWKSVASRILPVIALAFGTMATISRLMRSSMLDVISSDYIKTARAKGLSQNNIIRRHMMRNSILPVITILGPLTAAILTGSFVIENIFAIPGMGKLFVSSVLTQDYTVIMATTMFYGAFLIFANLIVDIVYGLIDPRIRLTK